jgi:hypothetical protein
MTASGTLAAPSGEEICRKMLAEGRSGYVEETACLCVYEVSLNALDEDIRALLHEAWYSGADNTKELEALPNQSRIGKQMSAMRHMIFEECGF